MRGFILLPSCIKGLLSYVVPRSGSLFLSVYRSGFAELFLQYSFITLRVKKNQTAERPLNLPTMKDGDKGSFRAASCTGVQSAETRRAETLERAGRPTSARCVKLKYHPSAGVKCQRLDFPSPFKGYRLERRAFVLQTVGNEVIVNRLPSAEHSQSNNRLKGFHSFYFL